jgi:hypothetical protein
MLTHIIVEVEPNASGGLPSRLITAAYQASCTGPVTLVLRGASSAAVDRVLDPVVVHGRRDVCGVRYVHASDRAGVMAAAQTARIAVGRTSEFRTLVEDLGVPCFPPEEAESVLAALVPNAAKAPATPYIAARTTEAAAAAR